MGTAAQRLLQAGVGDPEITLGLDGGIDRGGLFARIGQQGEDADEHAVVAQQVFFGDALAQRHQFILVASCQRVGILPLTPGQARLAWRERQDAYALARRYQDELVPLRQRIAEENLLRYNGMLISVFALLADAREQAATVNAAIEAQRDFWIADASLQQALGGRPQPGKQP